MISCACGCGHELEPFDNKGRLRKFIHGHHSRGKITYWKGDDVGRYGLHKWVRRHLPIPPKCQMCGENKKLDLANVTGVYMRDFTNWKYFCRKCHIAFDNNVGKAWITKRTKQTEKLKQ